MLCSAAYKIIIMIIILLLLLLIIIIRTNKQDAGDGLLGNERELIRGAADIYKVSISITARCAAERVPRIPETLEQSRDARNELYIYIYTNIYIYIYIYIYI